MKSFKSWDSSGVKAFLRKGNVYSSDAVSVLGFFRSSLQRYDPRSDAGDRPPSDHQWRAVPEQHATGGFTRLRPQSGAQPRRTTQRGQFEICESSQNQKWLFGFIKSDICLLQGHMHSYREAFEDDEADRFTNSPTSRGGGEISPQTPSFPVSPQTPYFNMCRFSLSANSWGAQFQTILLVKTYRKEIYTQCETKIMTKQDGSRKMI